MKVKSRDEAIELLNAVVTPNERIEICMLYGSGAMDSLNDLSDLDIVVGSEKGLSREDCLDLSLTLSGRSGRETTVLQIEKLEGLILREVLNKGIYIKNVNPGYHSRFIIKMYDYVEDILPFQFQEHQRQIRNFLNG